MKLGVIVALEEGPEEAFRKVHELGFPTCQLSCWHDDLYSPAMAERATRAAAAYGVEITTLWAGMPGRHVWDFIQGPDTIGIVPPATRARRMEALKRGSDFARLLGVPSITTHVGFIPENMSDPLYPGVVQAVREIAGHCAGNGQGFWFETGEETPVVLLRTIQEAATGNLGVNLDPANLLLYGKANPIDALDIIGAYVRGVHAKDGEYPTDGLRLGQEKPLGKGRVNFPLLLRKLKTLGFDGALTIEREIRGPQQIADIKKAKTYLERLLSKQTD
jgi:sugar phosphate isomerase/epimerase